MAQSTGASTKASASATTKAAAKPSTKASTAGSGKTLVIVESPTKMRSIQGYLGDGYEVLSSVGHIRDLADKKDIPAELKKTSVGKYSIDIENGFTPLYVESERGKKTVADLKRALKSADQLLLATDEDREGEAIAWHLLQALQPKVPVKRMVFHEITKDAIRAAVGNTRELDLALVDAQETRRILDRLYGWDVSDVTRRKVGQGTSAGRVQSAATRLVVDRERERIAFVSADYWDVEAVAAPAERVADGFATRLARLDGAPLARGTDFDDAGQLKKAVVVLTEPQARALATALEASGDVVVVSVEAKPGTRSPKPPFTTSTMQQEAGRKLSMSAKHAMGVAQRLYEKGYITYMRTDSTAPSTQAIAAARASTPEVIVLVDHRTLLDELERVGVAHLDDGTPISGATARRLACEAGILPAVLGADSEVLDLGRSRRLASVAQRRALLTQWRHCPFPGCTIPIGWTRAHQPRPMERGRPHRPRGAGAVVRTTSPPGARRPVAHHPPRRWARHHQADGSLHAHVRPHGPEP